MRVGMTILAGPTSEGLITPLIKWHAKLGVELFEACFHNPVHSGYYECGWMTNVRIRAQYTSGPITKDQQVRWTNDSIERLINRGAEYIMTADDDEYYTVIDPRLALYDGYCYHQTMLDGPGIPPLSMTWRDNDKVPYGFAKVGFPVKEWTGSMKPGNHEMSNCVDDLPRIPGAIHHFTYREGKAMFDHRQGTKYRLLNRAEIDAKQLVRDTTIRDGLRGLGTV